jgi:aminoglycoside phosphotransferase (APT) family kinase protein
LRDYVRGLGLQALIIGASKDPNAKITMLLVSPENNRPTLVVKIPTTDVAARAVEAETEFLRQLEKLRVDALRRTVPRVVDVVECSGRLAVVSTAVPGIPMTTSYFEWRHTRSAPHVAADFVAVGDWLASLQSETNTDPAELEMDGGIISRLRNRFAEGREFDEDIERLARIADRLRDDTVPRTVVHGDFWLGNVLLERQRVGGVVDWEGGSISGEPVRDLVRFALGYALYLDRRTKAGRRVSGHQGLAADSWGAGVAYALDGFGWFPDLFRSFIRDGLARLGASPDSWRDAVLAGIAEIAALTDDDAFARRHLELFRRLSDRDEDR